MRLILIVPFIALLTLASSTFVDEDFTLVEGQTPMSELADPVTEIDLVVEEPTTKRTPPARSQRITTKTTTLPTSVADEDLLQVTPIPSTTRKPTTNRSRMSGNRRKQASSKPKVQPQETAPVEEDENLKAEMTSPASVDTASVSILAPKNFKPTPKPLDDIQQAQGLMEFLKKRKMQRIQASTTEDPFVAILATATAPTTEEAVTVAGDSSSRFAAGSARRLPSTGRRFGSNSRQTTSTTGTPTTEATTTTTTTVASRRVSNNRFGAGGLRNKATTATTEATTTENTVTAEAKPTVDTLARSKLFPKRPANLRPIGNSISRRKDTTTSSTAAPTTAVATEEEMIGIPEEIELVEPITAAPLRKARGRLTARISGI